MARVCAVGGTTIQEECDAYIGVEGKLLSGQVFMSGAGQLPCQKVIHAVGPRWNGGAKGEANELYEAVYASLESLTTHRLTTIAIPAIGAGIYSIPMDVSARTIVSAVMDFCDMEPNARGLTEVQLIDKEATMVEHFHTAMVTAVGAERVSLLDTVTTPVSHSRPAQGQLFHYNLHDNYVYLHMNTAL